MYINVWIPYSPLVLGSIVIVSALTVWKIVKSMIQSIPFVG